MAAAAGKPSHRAAGFPAAVFQVPGRAWASGFRRVGECRTCMCGVTRGVSVSWSLEHTQGGIFLEYCSSLPTGPFVSGRGSRSPGRLCGDTAGSRGVSREMEFRYSQRGKEENRPSAGVHVLCPPAHLYTSDLISFNVTNPLL